jgi:hypothetical protein
MHSPALLDNLILLGSTALVSGFLIPFILKSVDERRNRSLKEREVDSARHAKVVEAQAEFLDELTRALWEWRYTSIRLTYYGAEGQDQEYQEARDTYRQEIWQKLSTVRYVTSKSLNLGSEELYRVLKEFYDRTVEVDKRAMAAMAADEKISRQLDFSDINFHIRNELSITIDSILLEARATLDLLGQGAKFRRNANGGQSSP